VREPVQVSRDDDDDGVDHDVDVDVDDDGDVDADTDLACVRARYKRVIHLLLSVSCLRVSHLLVVGCLQLFHLFALRRFELFHRLNKHQPTLTHIALATHASNTLRVHLLESLCAQTCESNITMSAVVGCLQLLHSFPLCRFQLFHGLRKKG